MTTIYKITDGFGVVIVPPSEYKDGIECLSHLPDDKKQENCWFVLWENEKPVDRWFYGDDEPCDDQILPDIEQYFILDDFDVLGSYSSPDPTPPLHFQAVTLSQTLTEIIAKVSQTGDEQFLGKPHTTDEIKRWLDKHGIKYSVYELPAIAYNIFVGLFELRVEKLEFNAQSQRVENVVVESGSRMFISQIRQHLKNQCYLKDGYVFMQTNQINDISVGFFPFTQNVNFDWQSDKPNNTNWLKLGIIWGDEWDIYFVYVRECVRSTEREIELGV